jgi:hypothetical protein
MDSEEQKIFREGLRHATATNTGEALDDALDELGWRDALATDRRAAVSCLFELQGSANASSSALDAVLVDTLGFGKDSKAGVVLPPLGCRHPPGRVTGARLEVRGIGTAALRRRDEAAVVAAAGDGHVVFVVDTAALELCPVSGVDPAIGLVEAVGDRVGGAGPSPTSPTTWANAVATGQLGIGHELVGASRAMLQLARDHAVERSQFGRPIAAFQAVRHRLAESFVALEAADAALGAAWDAGSPLDAAVAKAIAGRRARTVARHCQQVLAGIGFTTEHPFHRYLRRTLVLDALLGDARSLTREVGDQLLATRRLASLLPL